MALLSPLVLYAGREVMPLAALFFVAGGIALALALAGRQLHAVLLSEAISGRTNKAKVVLAAGMMLLVLLLVLLAAVLALLFLLKGGGRSPAGFFGG